MKWEPCSECKSRLEQMKLDISQQTHVRGLQELEVVTETRDAPLRGNWIKRTRFQCENCDLKWLRK